MKMLQTSQYWNELVSLSFVVVQTICGLARDMTTAELLPQSSQLFHAEKKNLKIEMIGCLKTLEVCVMEDEQQQA